MNNLKQLNIFISYSHLDEPFIDEFIKHISPLENQKSISIWHDRKITAGREFQDRIDTRIKDADIICLPD